MKYPIQSGFKVYVTQEYGLTAFAKTAAGKAAYKNFPGGIHPGYDFGTGGVNAPAIALMDGRVVRAFEDGGWGNHVEIEANDGWRRQYAHLASIAVKVGQVVKGGDVLGKVGTTGASTGIHLHYGKRRFNVYRYEYADPSDDFKDGHPPELPPDLTEFKLVKGSVSPRVYALGIHRKTKHYLPNMETLLYLFGGVEIHTLDQGYLDKIPEAEAFPNLKD